jgi:hypothetical protein
MISAKRKNSMMGYSPCRASHPASPGRQAKNQIPTEIFHPLAQKNRGKVLFPCDRTDASDWTSEGTTGIASPTGHRRSNNYRKVVAQRSDSRSAAPIRIETGTSVPPSTGRSRERPVLSFPLSEIAPPTSIPILQYRWQRGRRLESKHRSV